jgi:hypothetical protein
LVQAVLFQPSSFPFFFMHWFDLSFPNLLISPPNFQPHAIQCFKKFQQLFIKKHITKGSITLLLPLTSLSLNIHRHHASYTLNYFQNLLKNYQVMMMKVHTKAETFTCTPTFNVQSRMKYCLKFQKSIRSKVSWL